jgi:hypothetical protein
MEFLENSLGWRWYSCLEKPVEASDQADLLYGES